MIALALLAALVAPHTGSAGVVVNDSVFAVVLGVSFTSTIGLMAWTVKTLATLVGRVEALGDRVEWLERQHSDGTGRHR